MPKAGAAIESARGYHKLSFAISVTALILLFTPLKYDFSTALKEAYALRELKIDDYKTFVRGFIGQNSLLPPRSGVAPGDWGINITRFLNSEMDQNVIEDAFPNPTWSITEIVDYEQPPNDGTLVDWSRWISSSKPASYYHPDWKTAELSMDRQGAAKPLVRHFGVRPSRYSRSAREYTFRAYLDLRVTAADQSEYVNERAKRENWWSELERSDFQGLERPFRDLGVDRWILEGEVDSTRKVVNGKTGINDWLRQRGIWAVLSDTNDLGEAVIPGIREHWAQLGGETLAAAISFMESSHQEISAVTLLGLPIPGELCLVATPLAYLLVYLFLFLDIRFLRSLQRSGVDVDTDNAMWMGLYNDRLAVWTTAISIAVIPTALMLGLLLRYHSMVQVPVVIMSVLALIIAAIVQVLVVCTTAEARKVMAYTSQDA